MKLLSAYPFLLSIFFVMSFYARNIEQVPLFDMVEVLVFALAAVTLLQFLFAIVFNSWSKASLMTAATALLFFTYGHVVVLLPQLAIEEFLLRAAQVITKRNISIGIHSLLFPAWILLFVYALVRVHRMSSITPHTTARLNRIGVVLIVLPVVTATPFLVANGSPVEGGVRTSAVYQAELSRQDLGHMPDVYYIVLDGYARSSTLERHSLDNSEFEQMLRAKGFYIPPLSRSNYAHTFLSLAASLNMRYVNELGAAASTVNDPTPAHLLVQNSEVARIFRTFGYYHAHVSSGWQSTNHNAYAHRNIVYPLFFTEFASKFLATTMAEPFARMSYHERYRDSIIYNFNEVASLAAGSYHPVFVTAHMMIPHPPYVFDKYCNPIPDDGRGWQPPEKYVAMVQCTNRLVNRLVEQILTDSERKPIIIIHADHGARLSGQFDQPLNKLADHAQTEALDTFTAILLPDNRDIFYDTLTPVNIFRIILREYFAVDLENILDKTYWSEAKSPYRFSIVE